MAFQKFVVQHADGTPVTQAQKITLYYVGTQTEAYAPFYTNASGSKTQNIANGSYDACTNDGCRTTVAVPTVPQITLQNSCAT